MIGLKRGTVKLVSYNPKWKTSFEREKKRIQKALGNLAISIEHVGSTAIPELSAKPIIDIAIIVKSIKSPGKLVRILESLGYEFKKDDDVLGRLFFTKGPESKRTHYIHVVKFKGKEWKKLTLFRDYLLSHKQAIQKCSGLKNKLAKDYALDRKSYTSGKNEFIRDIIKKAKNAQKSGYSSRRSSSMGRGGEGFRGNL